MSMRDSAATSAAELRQTRIHLEQVQRLSRAGCFTSNLAAQEHVLSSELYRILELNPESVLEQKFGGMLHALSLGAPPHGGIAPGIDRIVMLLAGEENLREVVLFPMNQRAEDLLMGAPSEVTQKQLRELHIRLDLPKK